MDVELKTEERFVIKAQSLVKSFTIGGKELPVLKGIDLNIEAGKIISIVGSSGSGKSTLMNILGCLDRPCSGRYWISGLEASTLNSDQLADLRAKKIGFVFQKFNLLPDLSAAENVILPQLYQEIPRFKAKERALKLLYDIGLAQWADHRPYQLSGGQQQRVAIARAIANNPEIIFADEPTGALDSKTGLKILELFTELVKERKMTIILVTHDQKVAQTADHIFTMVDGQLV